jgi:hypothetical protein
LTGPAEKFNSTDDARIDNNPLQMGAPGDPMRLQYRVLSEEEKATMGGMKKDYERIFMNLDALGSSRELSIAKTKLEESCMWAVKHLTR